MLALAAILVFSLVQHSSGLQPEYTVIVHVDRLEKKSGLSNNQPQWLIGSEED